MHELGASVQAVALLPPLPLDTPLPLPLPDTPLLLPPPLPPDTPLLEAPLLVAELSSKPPPSSVL